VGQVDVAGTTYDILEVRRCEPLQKEMLDRDLEVQGFGVHGGERVQIDVYVQEVAGQQLDEVSWAGPEGIFGGPEDAAVPFDGSVVRGSATVRDSLTQEQTLPVTFELEVPDEIVRCRWGERRSPQADGASPSPTRPGTGSGCGPGPQARARRRRRWSGAGPPGPRAGHVGILAANPRRETQ